jgi:hypothetical protein
VAGSGAHTGALPATGPEDTGALSAVRGRGRRRGTRGVRRRDQGRGR